MEGWEIIYGATFIGTTLALVLGYNTGARETFRDWARKEALAGEEVVENGGEIEFGKNKMSFFFFFTFLIVCDEIVFFSGKYYYNYNDIKFKEGEALDSPAEKADE